MSEEVDPDQLYSTGQVAMKMQVSQDTVRNWINEGQLKSVKLNRFHRIKHSDLVEFIKRRYD